MQANVVLGDRPGRGGYSRWNFPLRRTKSAGVRRYDASFAVLAAISRTLAIAAESRLRLLATPEGVRSRREPDCARRRAAARPLRSARRACNAPQRFDELLNHLP